MNDIVWIPACPEPFFFGWRLRKTRCRCGAEFKNRDLYREHWYPAHARDASPRDPRAGVPREEAERLLGPRPTEGDE